MSISCSVFGAYGSHFQWSLLGFTPLIYDLHTLKFQVTSIIHLINALLRAKKHCFFKLVGATCIFYASCSCIHCNSNSVLSFSTFSHFLDLLIHGCSVHGKVSIYCRLRPVEHGLDFCSTFARWFVGSVINFGKAGINLHILAQGWPLSKEQRDRLQSES